MAATWRANGLLVATVFALLPSPDRSWRVSHSPSRNSWVMGQVMRGKDMVTLQSCTPIPTFEQRLIVRADRV